MAFDGADLKAYYGKIDEQSKNQIPKCTNCGSEFSKSLLKDNSAVAKEACRCLDNIFNNTDGVYCKSCAKKVVSKIQSDIETLKRKIPGYIDQIPIVSINNPSGWVYETIGVVTGQSTTGTGVFSEIASGITDFFGMQSGQYNQKIADGERVCLSQLRYKTYLAGGNAIIALDIDYAELGSLKGMIMVCATGTAIRILNYEDIHIKQKVDVTFEISEIEKKMSSLEKLNKILLF